MSYTIAAGKSFNLVLSHIDKSDPSTWTHRFNKELIMDEFSGWDPKYVACPIRVEYADQSSQTHQDHFVDRPLYEMAIKSRKKTRFVDLTIIQTGDNG